MFRNEMRLMPAATLVSQNLKSTLVQVLKSYTHHPVSTEQSMDGAVACTYVEPLCMKINEHFYAVIRMTTDAERTIEHVTARAMEIPDGCSHSFHKPHNIASWCSSHGVQWEGQLCAGPRRVDFVIYNAPSHLLS